MFYVYFTIIAFYIESKRSDDAKSSSNAAGGLSPMKEGVIRTTGGLTREEAEGGGVQPALLHSGPLLGTQSLPSCSTSHVHTVILQWNISK